MSDMTLEDAVTLAGATTGAGATTASAPMEAEDGALFCPRRGVNAGATKRLQADTRTLLQDRLRALALIAIVPAALSCVRFLFVDPIGAWGAGAFTLVGAGCWLFLRQPRRSRTELNIAGTILIAGMLLSIGVNSYLLLGEAIGAGDFGSYRAQVNRLPGLYLLIMLAYALFIPSRWQQTLKVVLGMVVAAVIPGLALEWTHQEAFTAARESINIAEQMSFTLLMLFSGAMFAVFGSYVIHGYRRAAAEVDDAGMYRLLGKLGEGGMGEVWRAEHRMLARPAAIKIIRPELLGAAGAADMARRRFTREARATAALQSPNTVQLYDFGATQDGTFFYVMEMLRGMDMEDLVKRYGPMPPARAVHLLRQAAMSLQEAHDRGLIHRDVKPGNLHVGVVAGQADWVKVLDFGLVRSFAAERAGEHLTVEGVTTGTPAYFPPEMAAGAQAADARSDVYALAAVGYWLITGQLIFTANTPLEMVLQHVQKQPVPPSQRTETVVPPALETAILAGLSKDPAERPQSMREFASLLAASVGDWTADQATEWWRLHEPESLGEVA
jgi:hypothetical protein